jgi:hypothetical protein
VDIANIQTVMTRDDFPSFFDVHGLFSPFVVVGLQGASSQTHPGLLHVDELPYNANVHFNEFIPVNERVLNGTLPRFIERIVHHVKDNVQLLTCELLQFVVHVIHSAC